MENHFTIAVDSCNHIQWIEHCLNSCLSQRFDNYEVVVMDAVSTDGTFELCKKYEKQFKNLKVYQNEVRLPQVANFVELNKLAKDDSILVSIDSDDFLKSSNALNILDKAYGYSNDIWMTYGSYVEMYDLDKPLRDVSWHYHAYPQEIIDNNSFREYKWMASHTRTWRKKLFDLIDVDKHLKLPDGKWFDTVGDQSVMYCLLELSGPHSRFVKTPTYVYNTSNQNRDSAKNRDRQIELEKYVRSLPKYQRIDKL